MTFLLFAAYYFGIVVLVYVLWGLVLLATGLVESLLTTWMTRR